MPRIQVWLSWSFKIYRINIIIKYKTQNIMSMSNEISCNELWRRFEAQGGSLVYKRKESKIVLMTPIRSFSCQDDLCVAKSAKQAPVFELKERGITQWAYYQGEAQCRAHAQNSPLRDI